MKKLRTNLRTRTRRSRIEPLEPRCTPTASVNEITITPGGTNFGPSSFAANDNELLAFNNDLIFRVNNYSQGQSELWVSDGSQDGTTRLAKFTNDQYHPFRLTPTGPTTLVFNASDGTNNGLWQSDGTAAGTTFIAGTQGAYEVTRAGNHLLYLKDVPDPRFPSLTDTELWSTDLTGGGANRLSDNFGRATMVAGNGMAFLDARATLMVSDGNGTTNLNEGIAANNDGTPESFAVVGGQLYFEASDQTLWTSDGSQNGTKLLKAINQSGGDPKPQGFAAAGGLVFFSADDGINGRELWTTDGTQNGTQLVADINQGSTGSFPSYIVPGGKGVLFAATRGDVGRELWTSDGTSGGTSVFDINPGSADSNPQWLARLGNLVYFSAVNLPFGAAGAVGDELWQTDGTSNGTKLVADIDRGQLDSNPRDLTAVGGTLFFDADDGTHGTNQLFTLGTGSGGGPGPGGNWVPIGPAPILNGDTAGSQPVSGRVTGVATDPKDAGTIFIATAGGGVWRTTDGGIRWTALTDHVTDPTSGKPVPLFMGAIAEARDAKDNEIVYAGTGEANNSGDTFYGEGILVSFDGGATWKLQNNKGAFIGATVAKIVIDPNDTTGKTAYAAIDDNGVGKPGDVVTGIYKTFDGGTTWKNLTSALTLGGIPSTDNWSDVVLDPKHPGAIYAADGTVKLTADGLDTEGGGANGVYWSVNDGGSWNNLGGIVYSKLDGRIALGLYDDGTTGELFVSVAKSSIINNPGLGRMLKVNLSDQSYTDLTENVLNTAGNYLSSQGYFDTALAIDPKDKDHIYAAGDQSSQGGSGGYAGSPIQSFDGGVTWHDIANVGGIGPHTDAHAAAFDKNGNLIEGDDGGVFELQFDPSSPKTQETNAGTWKPLNTNLQTAQFTGVAIDPTTGTIYGGSQDNGTEKYGGTMSWQEVLGGDGGITRVSVAPSGAKSIYATVGSTTPNLNVSTDGNQFSNLITTSGFSSNFAQGVNYNLYTSGLLKDMPLVNFYAPYAIDSAGAIYYGTDVLNISTDHGATWNPIGSPNEGGFNPPSLNSDGSTSTKPIAAIAVAPSDNKVVYVSTGDSMFVTQNALAGPGNVQWTALVGVIDDVLAAGRNSLAVDPAQPATAYAVKNIFSNSGHVFKRTSFSGGWTDISGDLPNIPVRAVALSADGKAIYIGTDVGVYASTNGGAHWAPLAPGLPNVQVIDVEVGQNLIVAGTHGRGAWVLNGTNGLAPTITSTNTTTFTVGQLGTFTVRTTGIGAIKLSANTPGFVQFDDNGDGTATLRALPLTGTDGSYVFSITATNPSGTQVQLFILNVRESPAGPTPHQFYVTAVYHDVLGRAPDAGGLAYWAGQLDAGAPISSVAAAIGKSDEYYVDFVIRPDYLKLFGRAADDGGVAFWVAQMRTSATDQQLQADLVASDEFYASAGGNDSGWVQSVYKQLLGRVADADGLNYWLDQLAAGELRSDVAQGIAGSHENNTNLINDDYFHYLGRGADPGGLNYWLSQFAAGATNEDVIAGFTGSAEYYQKNTS